MNRILTTAVPVFIVALPVVLLDLVARLAIRIVGRTYYYNTMHSTTIPVDAFLRYSREGCLESSL
eukprot:COSAG02_NODE_386_length_23297_cov_32.396457_4_plen_65_part_00